MKEFSFACCLVALAGTAWAGEAEDERRKEERAQLEHEITEISGILVIGRRQRDGVPVVPVNSIGSRDVFGPERVKETGARDINDLVQNLPSISTRPYNGGEAAAPSFSMRGLPDDGLTEYVHILIDGVPASALPYGWTAFSFLPLTPDRIYAIDYIRGGHAVRYSPNTVGGILNFITRPIPGAPLLTLRQTFGDFDYRSTLVSAGGSWDAFGLIATFVDRRGDGYREQGSFDQQDANVKFRWDIDPQSWLAVALSYMQDAHQAPGGLTPAEFAADRYRNARPENRFDGHRFLLDLVYRRETSDRDWWEGFSYLSKTKRHLRARRPHFGTPATVTDWEDNSWFFAVGARGQRVAQLAGMTHTLYGGFRYQREWIPSWKLRSEPFQGGAATPTQNAEYTLDTFSLHLDDTFEPLENLTVVLGLRVEWLPTAEGSDPIGGWSFDDSFFTLLPGVGASYLITREWALFANYFKGFRAPQVWGFAFTTGTGSLDFEKGTSLEAGTRYRGRRGLSGAITFWRTEYDNFGVFFTGFYENLGRIVATGVDLEGEWQLGEMWLSLDGFSVAGSVTLQDSELRSGPNAGNGVPYAWETKAAWRLRYARRGWTASVGGTFVGESFADEANTSVPNANGNIGINPSRVVWDARLARRFELGGKAVLELAVGATNVFDKQWLVRSRGGFFGGGIVAGPPRQGYVTLNLDFSW